jgi:hypothetical protein
MNGEAFQRSRPGEDEVIPNVILSGGDKFQFGDISMPLKIV